MQIASVSPCLVLAAYAEPWINGAKVALVGSGASPVIPALLERGARSVHVFETEAGKAGETTRRRGNSEVVHSPVSRLVEGGRDLTFDLVLVEDLARVDLLSGRLLAGLARSLSRRGKALIASPNPESKAKLFGGSTAPAEALSYYEFFDQVSAAFDEVLVLGQAPFVGYSLAQFGGPEDPELAVDMSFLGGKGEAPEWFVALGSREPVTAEAYTVIQLPRSGLSHAEADAGRERRGGPPAATLRAELEASRKERAVLQRQLAELKDQLGDEAADKTTPSGGGATSGASLELRRELEARDQWTRELEARAATADERADEMQATVESLQQELARAKSREARLREDVDRSRGQRPSRPPSVAPAAEAQDAGAQLERLQRDKRTLEQLAARERQEAAAARAETEALKRELEAAAQLKSERDELKSAIAGLDAQKRAAEALKRAAEQNAQVAQREHHGELSALQSECTSLENQLRERGAEVQRLNEELRAAERFGRQLLAELQSLREDPESTLARLELLNLRNAELAADLEAARWSLEQLRGGWPAGVQPTDGVSAADTSG